MKLGFLEEVKKNMENGIYDFTKNGECTGCGNCCSNLLPVTKKEIREIKSYIRIHHIKEEKHFMPTTNPTLDLMCPFRNEREKKCNIYSVRPKICKSFICNPQIRNANNDSFGNGYFPINVRKTFFG